MTEYPYPLYCGESKRCFRFKMLKCESCELEFDNKATLLRHVSHKKVCKLYYGEDRIQDMRIDGKLESKRKWWKSHANEAKEAYKLNKKDISKKRSQKYISRHQRFKTDQGIAFQEFHGFLYDYSKDKALEKLKNSEFVTNKGHEIAKTWMESATKELKDKCSLQTWDSAFKNYFKEFSTSLFPSIQNKSFDLAFAALDETTDDKNSEDIQKLLERKYDAALSAESFKSAIDSELSFKLTNKIELKIEKQIRAMKARD